MHRNAALAAAIGLAMLGLAGTAAAQLTSEDIERLREEGVRKGWTFTVAENAVTGIPLEQLCRTVEPPGWQKMARWDPCLPDGRDLPAAFDWRLVDPYGAATPIRNQGQCGSCWAFGAMGTVECNIVRATGEYPDLSEQWLISCTPAGNCNGGWHTYAFEAMSCNGVEYADLCGDHGAVWEADCPYTASNSACHCPYTHPYCLDGWACVGDPWTTATVEQIKQAIYDHGPVATCMAATSSFQSYHSGVFNNCCDDDPNDPCTIAEDLNHVMVIMGWDDNAGPAGAWTVRNSWTATWGMSGYGKISYGCNLMGYATAYVVFPSRLPDCNGNSVADANDISTGFSQDCNSDGVPDECEILPNQPLIAQVRQLDIVLAQDCADAGYPLFSTKEWDDFTTATDVCLGTGRAFFHPDNWGGYGTIGFLVEVADIPGGAEAGGHVLASTIGSGANGIVNWDFAGTPLPAGTYWLSVQASGGFSSYGWIYQHRANKTHPNGSQHYYHNPLGGQGHGTAPTPGSSWWGTTADVAFTQNVVVNPDCNTNGILDDCDIAAGTSHDANGDGIPDECQTPPGCPGDGNCDGRVDWRDIEYFVAAMVSESSWENMFLPGAPTCPFSNNDVSQDGTVNWRDVDPLVAVMSTNCP